jgi:hypothetical protein
MVRDQWQRTGQPILISDKNVLLDSQHRLWASYLSGCTFPSFVVTDIPHVNNVFAYIDNGAARSPTDALYTAGLDGIANRVAAAVKIAWSYDGMDGCYFSMTGGEVRPRKLTPIEVLEYVMQNPTLPHAAHVQLAEYETATNLINDKGLAVFIAWRITDAYNDEMLEDFMVELCDEDSENTAIILLRKRLFADAQQEKSKRMRPSLKLAYITKAFNAWRLKQTLTRLNLKSDEPWPKFIDKTVDPQ